MTELMPDDQTVWAARKIAAVLPEGQLQLAGVATAIPEAIAALLRNVLENVAVGNTVSLIVREPKASPDQTQLAMTLAADGKIVSG